MMIVDTALARRAAEGAPPIRIGMIGAGYMGAALALQLALTQRGRMRLVAIASRTPEKALAAFEAAGDAGARRVDGPAALARAIAEGAPAVTDDPLLVAAAPDIDVLLEATGAIDGAAAAVLAAIGHGKHVVSMNAELDGTIGALIRARADAAGVVYTNVDGDQPGVIENLRRFVVGIGLRPVLLGNIKGLQDPYRNPETQVGYAAEWGQKPAKVASFADGTKISFEQAVVANATGMTIARRGMTGPTVPAGTPIEEAAKLWDAGALLAGPGIVDYVVGAAPAPGVFVLAAMEHPRQRHFLRLYKMGDGPLYCFTTPYHLCHFEVPATIARAVLFGDAAIAPRAAAPEVEVIALAKRDLAPGDVVDELGGFAAYGVCETGAATARDGLLPLGVALGARLVRPVAKDAALTYADVALPPGRLIDRLRAEQDALFGVTRPPAA